MPTCRNDHGKSICNDNFYILVSYFELMQLQNGPCILTENIFIDSSFLKRKVQIDLFLPRNVVDPSQMNLLLINDGQNLGEMNFHDTLEDLYATNEIMPVLCAGIHAGKERKKEYGVASQPDYLGRGSLAGSYASFVLQELMPLIHSNYSVPVFREKAIAGFSLGALMALDIAWNHSGQFSRVGAFSGSFWWRSIDQANKNYDDNKHRIMQQVIRQGSYKHGLKFFFQCGNMDETMDRNNNGIIDSIDDTMAVIAELEAKGYDRNNDIFYLEIPDGKHDVPTWARAMPDFLKWGWGK